MSDKRLMAPGDATRRHWVVVESVEQLARDVSKLTLVCAQGAALPGFTPGAHLDLHLPNGLVRSYSLINQCVGAQVSRYELAIGLDAKSRGGSSFVHGALTAGSALAVGSPRNHFPLVDTTDPVFFLAGGIGVTPIRAMARELQRRDHAWQLVYAARSRASAAFVDEFAAWGDRVRLHFDDERGGPLDVAFALSTAPSNAHVYCCGPSGLMERVKALCADRDPARVHFEWFNPPAVPPRQVSETFTVKLARQNLEIAVPAEKSILDVLEDHGVIIPSVCKEGVCGTCECRILSGEVEHRDTVLTETERTANETLMVCVSRAKGKTLVLDL